MEKILKVWSLFLRYPFFSRNILYIYDLFTVLVFLLNTIFYDLFD